MFANALRLLGTRNAFVVHGHDGLDEISVCDRTRVSELRDGLIKTYDIDPETIFGQLAKKENLTGGDPAENAGITRQILLGEKGPMRDVVVINAAAALVAADKAKSLDQGIRQAGEAIDNGSADEKLNQLVTFTQEAA